MVGLTSACLLVSGPEAAGPLLPQAFKRVVLANGSMPMNVRRVLMEMQVPGAALAVLLGAVSRGLACGVNGGMSGYRFWSSRSELGNKTPGAVSGARSLSDARKEGFNPQVCRQVHAQRREVTPVAAERRTCQSVRVSAFGKTGFLLELIDHGMQQG